jgi:hypothetical protein
LEGLPEITVTLSLPAAAGGKPTAQVQDFIVDSRVQATNVAALKKLTFAPPLGQYPLCSYTVTALPKLPLRGFYQMKVCCPLPPLFDVIDGWTSLLTVVHRRRMLRGARSRSWPS